jgi:hypothetical protein
MTQIKADMENSSLQKCFWLASTVGFYHPAGFAFKFHLPAVGTVAKVVNVVFIRHHSAFRALEAVNFSAAETAIFT